MAVLEASTDREIWLSERTLNTYRRVNYPFERIDDDEFQSSKKDKGKIMTIGGGYTDYKKVRYLWQYLEYSCIPKCFSKYRIHSGYCVYLSFCLLVYIGFGDTNHSLQYLNTV